MKKEKIYIVKVFFKSLKEWGVDNISFKDMDKAIEYCNSKLTEEEQLKRENQLKRNLISWYEFYSKNYIYEIKEIDLV